jgi:hypothetical protein
VDGLDAFGTSTIAETNTTETDYSWATIPTIDITIKTGAVTDNLTTNTPQMTSVWFGVSPTMSDVAGDYTVTVTYTVEEVP